MFCANNLSLLNWLIISRWNSVFDIIPRLPEDTPAHHALRYSTTSIYHLVVLLIETEDVVQAVLEAGGPTPQGQQYTTC